MGVGPVSYTHLDVYKRQLHVNGGIRIACQAAAQHGYEVSDRLRFITVIPPYEVHTSEARKVCLLYTSRCV